MVANSTFNGTVMCFSVGMCFTLGSYKAAMSPLVLQVGVHPTHPCVNMYTILFAMLKVNPEWGLKWSECNLDDPFSSHFK